MGELGVDSPFQADARTFAGLVVAVLIGAVATAAGVGGGAIFIPLFNILVGFALKPSTALSQACITFGSLAAVLSNLPRTHPNVPDAPLIDFPLMLLLTPVLLVGVGIGVLLNVTLPSWLLSILLLLLLLLLLTQAVAKGRALWAQESKRSQAAAEAAARHNAEGGEGGTSPAATASRNALLGADHQSSNHLAASTAAAAAAGLRNRRLGSIHGPRGPRGLEPDQEASFGCLEGLDADATAVVFAANVAGGAGAGAGGGGGSYRRRAAEVSLDCMEGVATLGDGAASCETPSSSGPLLSSAFAGSAAEAAARPPSSTGDEDMTWAGAGVGAVRSGHNGASPTPLSPASSLAYAPSWRAFNELGALDFETDLEGEFDGEGAATGGPAGRPSTRRSGFGSAASSPALPPTARLLSQLLRRPLPPGLQLSQSVVTRSPGAPFRRRSNLARRSSFDQTTAIAGDVAAGTILEEDEETGGGADSWLQRRSKWRSRFPPGVLPHRGGSRAPLLPPPVPSALQSAASGSSSRASGSELVRIRSRSLRTRDGDGADGGADGGAGLDQPLLGQGAGGTDLRYGASPDPRAEVSRPPAGPAAAAGGGGGDAGGGGFGAADIYRPPSRLETLHEEVDDRVEPMVRPTGQWSRKPPAAAEALISAPAMMTPFAAASVTAAAAVPTPRTPALPASRPAGDWDSSAIRAGSTSYHLEELQPQRQLAYDNDVRAAAGAADAASATAGPSVYLEIHSEAAARGGHRGGGWRRRARRAGGAVRAAASDWADSWKAAWRRIPRRFLAGLVVAWLLFLGLQSVRAFQPHCSPAWWVLFVLQIVAMLVVSVAALVMTASAVAKHAEAERAQEEEAAAAGRGGDKGRGRGETAAGEGVAEAVAGVVAEAEREAKAAEQARRHPSAAAAAVYEPAMSGTAALLVLQAPLSTLFATFLAGLTGGLLGLGGGMVMGPLLLQIGVQPQVTAASSGAMVLFSSSAALIQFALLHRLNVHYAAVFGAASLVAGVVGTHAVAGAIKRSGRPSIVVLALAAVMAIGTLFVGVFGLREAALQIRSGQLGFVGICDKAGGK